LADNVTINFVDELRYIPNVRNYIFEVFGSFHNSAVEFLMQTSDWIFKLN